MEVSPTGREHLAYLAIGSLQSRYPDVDWFSHDAGHLIEMMFGWKTNPHAGPFHLLSFLFIGGGFILVSVAWKALYDAQQKQRLATSGPYRYVRHPQYVGFILVMFGFPAMAYDSYSCDVPGLGGDVCPSGASGGTRG